MASLRLQLPAGDANTFILTIVARVRDTLDGVTEFAIPSVIVVPDAGAIANFVNDVQQSSIATVSNPIVQLLSSGNQNIIAQVITSLSQVFNKMSGEITNLAVASKYPRIQSGIAAFSFKKFARRYSCSEYFGVTVRKQTCTDGEFHSLSLVRQILKKNEPILQ